MIIYKITNILNGKIYVGQTIQSANRRWSRHCSGIDSSAISSAIQKYGKDNFLFEIIEHCNSLNELNKKEEYFIQQFSCISPNGYNIKLGGSNYIQSEETKKKISLANAGSNNGRFGIPTIHSEETRKKISESKRGKSNLKTAEVLKGRTKENFSYLSDMAKKQSLKYKGAGNPNAKEICVFGKLYKTMKDASKSTGLSMYKLRKLSTNCIVKEF